VSRSKPATGPGKALTRRVKAVARGRHVGRASPQSPEDRDAFANRLQEMLDERRALVRTRAFFEYVDAATDRCIEELDGMLRRADVDSFHEIYRGLGIRAAVQGVALLLGARTAAEAQDVRDADTLASWGVSAMAGRLRVSRPPSPVDFEWTTRVVADAIDAAERFRAARRARFGTAIRNSGWEAAIQGLNSVPETKGRGLSKSAVHRLLETLGPPPAAHFELGAYEGTDAYRKALDDLRTEERMFGPNRLLRIRSTGGGRGATADCRRNSLEPSCSRLGRTN